MSRKKKSGNGALVVTALVLFVLAATGAYYVANMLSKKPTGTATVTARPVVTLTERARVKLYLPKAGATGAYLAPQERLVETRGESLDSALAALVAAGEKKGEATGLIPEGTRVLSPVKVKNGTATVNFSKEFRDNFAGGSDQEALVLNAIAHTLVDNSKGKVNKVRILVEGEPVESIGGHYDLNEPIEPDGVLLQPAEED